jgi:hypothetical protein
MFKLHFKKIALILSLGGMTGTGHAVDALDYCRTVASNEEGYGPLVLQGGQPLRQAQEGGSQYCVATRSCKDALNGEGYGHPFWSSSKLYRKIDQDWSNSNSSIRALINRSWIFLNIKAKRSS